MTYLDNGLHHLLDLARLDHTLGFAAEVGKFRLVRLDPSLEIRDVVLVETLSSVEEFANADQGISLALQILQNALVPCLALIFHQALTSSQMSAHGVQAVVKQGHLVGVGSVSVGTRLGQGCERHGDTGMVGSDALCALHQTIHDAANINVQLS